MTVIGGGADDWPYPAPIDDGRAAHLSKGIELPCVVLPATTGEAVDLSQTPGWSIVFIYPWTGRPGIPNPPGWDEIPGAHGSTPQAVGFRDCFRAFCDLGISIFGLSGQSTEDQIEFSDRMALPYGLLSDEFGQFRNAVRLPTFQAGEVTYLSRMTLIVRDGVIDRVIYPVHPPDRHAQTVLSELSAI